LLDIHFSNNTNSYMLVSLNIILKLCLVDERITLNTRFIGQSTKLLNYNLLNLLNKYF